MAEEEGWARIDGGAPASSEANPDEVMDKPDVWIEFAKKILAIGDDRPLDGMTRQTYGNPGAFSQMEAASNPGRFSSEYLIR